MKRELLACRNEFAVGEFRHVEIDIAMIESLSDFDAQHVVEYAEIDDHSRFGIDGTGDSHVTHIAMAVKVFPCATPEHTFVFFFAPVCATIPMRGGEGDSSG